ncbi:zinc finger protein ZFP2-like [Armigeres subalbatus]|uniref:zinc finger protein ZFP2-like n=1 Tax=Armigeres subalbatus TaxID=124917 RepID=UPI002ED20E8C
MASVAIRIDPEGYKGAHEICRLCLSEDLLDDIFAEDGLHQCILDLLLITVSADDRMSQAICAMCRLRLTEFHQYRMRCHEVQEALKSMIVSDVVEEHTVPIDGDKVPKHKKSSIAKKGRRGKQRPIQRQCEVCNAVFETQHQISAHRRKHRDNKVDCTICGKIFTFRKCFDKHMKIHKHEARIISDANIKAHKPSSVESNNSNLSTKTQTDIEEHKSTLPLREKIMIDGDKFRLKSEPVDILPNISQDEESRSYNEESESEELIGIDDFIVKEEVKIESTTNSNSKLPNLDSKASSSLEVSTNELIQKTAIDSGRTGGHARNPTKKLKPDQCDICYKKLSSSRNLCQHMKRVHGPKNFVCNVCDVGFPLQCKLNLHLATRMHKNKANEIRISRKPATLKCRRKPVQIQKESDRLPDNRDSIVQSAAIENNGEYPCTKCNQSFNRKCQLKIHMEIHNETGEKVRSIYMEDEEHLAEDNTNNAANITTNEVVQSSGVDTNESDHWQCRVCRKIFPSWKKLRNHKRNHGIKNFSCPVCKKSFVALHLLKKHVVIHEKKKGITPFECGICQNRFKDKYGLYYHKRVTHGPKNYACSICDYKHALRSYLTQHMKTHIRNGDFDTEHLQQPEEIATSTNSVENKFMVNIPIKLEK